MAERPILHQIPQVTCWACAGTGEGSCLVHVNRGEQPHEWRQVCAACGGRKTLPPGKALEAGRALRNARIARGESLREAAKRMGLRAADLSDLENGRAEMRGSDA